MGPMAWLLDEKPKTKFVLKGQRVSIEEKYLALREACLSITKRRRIAPQSKELKPCWCETPTDYCVGQPQCHKVKEALK